jgi:signal transduction histidine kinase
VSGGTAGSAELTGWWERMLPWWHAAFAATLTITTAAALLTGAPVVVLLPAALLAVAYPPLGAYALSHSARGRAAAYFAIAAVLLVWTTQLHPAGLLWLICLYPQCFATLEGFARAAPAAVVLTAVGFTSNADRNGWTHDAVIASLVSGAINLTVALAIGLFVDRLLRESERRAELVAALTAAQAELAAAHHVAGVHAERERFAREIHDTLAQGFTSIIVLARAIDAGLGAGGQGVHDTLALLEETAQANLAEARALVAALPPADLHDGGLLGALRRATDRCARELGVDAQLSVRGTPTALAASYDVVLLRVAQEALANVAKHSQAQHVTLTMTYGDRDVSLDVSDDGVGLSPGVPGGFGLAGMRQRVEEAGGQLCVEPAPGSGTTVRVVLP